METVLWNFGATQKVHRAMQDPFFLPLFKVLITRARWVQIEHLLWETQRGVLWNLGGRKILEKKKRLKSYRSMVKKNISRGGEVSYTSFRW